MKAGGKVFLATLALSLALSSAVFFAGLRKIEPEPIWAGRTGFEGPRAFAWARKLAKDFPNRVPWRPERRGAASMIKNALMDLGYGVSVIPFGETIGERRVEGLEDIFATQHGATLPGETVVVLAHYDVTDTTVEGAADDASGVGIVLELARVFRRNPPPRRNLVFLLTDSEEFGAFWGAHHFVEKFPDRDRIVAAVSLDFVAPGAQRDIMVLSDGLKSGYAPMWLRELALGSIRSVPYGADDTKNALEFVQRALLVPPSDHGAFLSAGIPALNLFGRSEDFAFEMGRIHHTPEDTLENLRPESFEPFGKATEILLRSLDALPPLLSRPDLRDGSYWKLSDAVYLAGWASSAIHWLLFIPFAVYIALLLRRAWHPWRVHAVAAGRVARSEMRSFGMILASLLGGYVLLRFLPALKVIETYEMFPATQKSPLLYRPGYVALGLILGVIVTIYVLVARLFNARAAAAHASATELRARHGLLGLILGLVSVFALAKNSYLAALLLLPPCYLWMSMKMNRDLESRALNLLLFLGGLVSFVAICIALTLYFQLGVFYWYLFLATSYGLISVYAAILALAAATVGIRILRNLVL